MSLTNSISDFFSKSETRKDKDNVLIVSIFFLTQEQGWLSTKKDFGVDDHFVEYQKPGGLKLITKGVRKGKKFDLLFEAHGRTKIKDRLVLDMDEFVTEDLKVINEDLLRVKLGSLLQSLDNRLM
jgi:hypothetical protein